MKIISIVGARPQFIKLFQLSSEIKKYYNEIILHTGQHFDKTMSELFFSELGITEPKYNLDINYGLHGEQTGAMLVSIEKIILAEKPNLVIVFGDTNSTLSGALVCAKLHIPILHVEAGLRSFNKRMPEEINRIIVDHISDYLFAPTQTAFKNLEIENLYLKSFLTGDIMVDSHRLAVEKSRDRKILEDFKLKTNNYYLLTLHRPYNVDDPTNLLNILNELGELNKPVIFPVHPRTKKIIGQNQLSISKNIIIIKPVGYLDFVQLQSNSYKIITDSGGIQKEAYILKKPCVTLRSETEWVETVKAGWNLLINPSKEMEYSKKIESFEPPSTYTNIFGENVTQKMIEIINRISA